MRDQVQSHGTAAPRASEVSTVAPGRTSLSQEVAASSQAGPVAQAADTIRSPDVAARPTVGIAALFGVPRAGGEASPIVSPDDTAATQSVTATIPKPEGAESARPAPGAQPAPGAGPGKTTSVSDLTGEPIISSLDRVAPTLTFSGSISPGGPVDAGDFAVTP